MYQTRVFGDKLYHAAAKGYGTTPIETFGTIEQGETPVSLLNAALASCVTMCVQGYFYHYHGESELAIETDAVYDKGAFRLQIRIERALDATMQDEVLAYIDQHCRVGKLLKKDINVRIDLG